MDTFSVQFVSFKLTHLNWTDSIKHLPEETAHQNKSEENNEQNAHENSKQKSNKLVFNQTL